MYVGTVCIGLSPVFLDFLRDLHTRRQMQITHVPIVTVAKMSSRNPIRPPSMMAMAMPLFSAVVGSVVLALSVALPLQD